MSLAILYEHPQWFQKVFDALDKRGVPYRKVLAHEHLFDPSVDELGPDVSVVLNRMSPSAYRREHGNAMYHTLAYLSHLERHGKRVINGERAFQHEISKALQLTLLDQLGLPYPKARVISHPSQAVRAADGLRFPIVVKPNVGGSGAGVTRFDSVEQLRAAAEADTLDFGLDHVALVQEFIPARGGHITRVETVGGRFIYAIKVFLTGQTFDLCPADICQTKEGAALETACPVEATKSGLQVEGYMPPPQIIAGVERMLTSAGIEVGGVEYVIDDRDGQLYYYDINALSNFVADAPRVVGFDPFENLADFLEQTLKETSQLAGRTA